MILANAAVKEEIVARAKALGFDSCKVTPAASPRHGEEFRSWLRDGAAGEMEWLERGADKRCDLQQVLAGARSVIVVALNYWQGEEPPPQTASAQGRIARYAWGDDYHDVMLRKLEQLSEFLSELGGTQKCYVDTGPILERDHAAEAGIGWHGKSTMLIEQKLGTWFFLGEILTTLDLPADAPQPARCGSCRRCITACPTGAITEPHRLDAAMAQGVADQPGEHGRGWPALDGPALVNGHAAQGQHRRLQPQQQMGGHGLRRPASSNPATRPTVRPTIAAPSRPTPVA